MFYILGLSFHDIFDLGTLFLIFGLLFLSIFSLASIFYLRIKSRNSPHLQNFNCLWNIRLLLVSFISLWALNEIIRLPFFQQRYVYPFFPSLTLSHKTNLCEIQVILSLGFLEPSFLIIMLFLVNVSIKRITPHSSWALVVIFSTCFPILVSQVFFLYASSIESHLPKMFKRSFVVYKNSRGEHVFCTYPLINSIIFGVFGMWYAAFFSMSCFKVAALVINKGLRVRIKGLALAIVTMLPLQVLFLTSSVMWRPDDMSYHACTFLIFFSTVVLASSGEGMLVIKPISDSLAVGGDIYQWINAQQMQQQQQDECGRQQLTLESTRV